MDQNPTPSGNAISESSPSQKASSVCAIVVTLQPGDDVAEGLAKLCPQVEGLVVIDNGSRSASLNLIQAASCNLGFKLIDAGENLGIAAAQNLGVIWAQQQGFKFVLFFDQDSMIPNGFVQAMLHCYEEQVAQAPVGIVVPRYRDSRLGHELDPIRTADGEIALAMCSGSLVPVDVFRRIGTFRAELFIDYVDYEFSLRARTTGYVLRECGEAVLLHAPADPQRRNIFSVLPVTTANYSAFRRYYLARNLVWMIRNYGISFPALCLRFLRDFFKDSIKILLVEDAACQKTMASMRGLVDGLRGKMGRTFER